MGKLLCALFGHRQQAGWWGDGLYGDLVLGAVDGTGRQHASVVCECSRCGKRYTRARVHMPTEPSK